MTERNTAGIDGQEDPTYMNNSLLKLFWLNARTRWQEWRTRPADIYVDLTRVNDRVCRRAVVVED